MNKETTKQVSTTPPELRNPTGKGGFGENPQNRHDGRWDKNDSISYQYNKLMRLSPDEVDKFKPETVAQMIALKRIRVAVTELGLNDTKEITDRTEGKAAQSIDLSSKDGTMTPTVIIEGVYANKPKFRIDNETTEADDMAADGSAESS